MHNASGSESTARRTGDGQAVFDTRTLEALALPRAGAPVFRAYWPVENGLLELEAGDSALGCVCTRSSRCGCSSGFSGLGCSLAIFLANAS